ncbi:MAG: CBS domain-containing protein, partial [Thermodesulfobacteriota bacterium]
KVREIMSPVYPLLKKNDRLNKAIYIMFRENIRQPLVQDKGEIVGILHLIDVFWELIAIAGDECFLSQKQV